MKNPLFAIHKIAIAPAGLINAFLINTDKHCILVDCGLPDTEDKVAAVLRSLGKDFSDISLIIVTHAHIDHAGNAQRLRQLSGAPLLAHEADLPYFLGEKKMHFCATGWFGHVFKQTGAIQKPYSPFQPDILLRAGESYDLNGFGINGRVIPTPGHTAGSVSVLIDNRYALVGDLISSGILLGGLLLTGKAKKPPFEENPDAVSDALVSLVSLGAEMFYMGHGGPLPQDEVLRHARRIAAPETAQAVSTGSSRAGPQGLQGMLKG
tara:strand:- start:497 stop:1291 length:795 start_codon:yes stop_codon:yes gene_type:complete